MSRTPEKSVLKKVLDVADRLGRLRQSLSEKGDGDRRAGRTVRAESRRAIRAVTSDLDSGSVPGMLGRLHQKHHFDDEQLTVLLLLLQRRIQGAQPSLSGRSLLAFLHEGSFDRLRGLRHLTADGLLRKSGIVEVEPGPDGGDLLDAEIRLADSVFQAIARDVTPEVETAKERPKRGSPEPYPDHRAHLLDMARLSRLYQRRARRVFESEEPDETLSRTAVKRVEREIRRQRARIAARLRRTAGGESFPLVRLQQAHRLAEEEILVLVTLLFQEVYAGTSYIEAIELVKMISAGDIDLMERRALLSPEGALVRIGLVKLTQEEGEHRLGGEAYLPPETVEVLLAGPQPEGPIDSDVRLAWHEYLEGLEDSGEFFQRL